MKSLLLLACLSGLIPLLGQLDERLAGGGKQTLQQASPFSIGFAVDPSRSLETGPYGELGAR